MALVLYLFGLAAALVATGVVYQCLGARRDRRRYTSEGRWIDIGGKRKLYLVEKGSSGPTVLFEAGIAATNLNWFHIQEAVSRFASTASYDRGGLGWSSPCRTARTPANLAAELHQMLEGAGIKPPYILVGHSFGGLVMRRFALNFPEEVTSMVLVDPMRCEEWPPLNPGKQSEIDRGRKLFRFAIPAARIGVARLAVASLFLRRQWRPARARPHQGRGGQDATGGLAHCCRPLVAARQLRRDVQARRGRARHREGDAQRRTDPEDPRVGADSREIDAAFRGTDWPHRQQRATGDCVQERALDSLGPTRVGDRFHLEYGDERSGGDGSQELSAGRLTEACSIAWKMQGHQSTSCENRSCNARRSTLPL
jgi:pimeloyl-ACP methyl ester carboxylesterase